MQRICPFSLSVHMIWMRRDQALWSRAGYMSQALPVCVVHLPGHRDYLRGMVLSLKSGQPKPLLALLMEILGRRRWAERTICQEKLASTLSTERDAELTDKGLMTLLELLISLNWSLTSPWNFQDCEPKNSHFCISQLKSGLQLLWLRESWVTEEAFIYSKHLGQNVLTYKSLGFPIPGTGFSVMSLASASSWHLLCDEQTCRWWPTFLRWGLFRAKGELETIGVHELKCSRVGLHWPTASTYQ